jgi:hypothetical protein
MLDLDTADAPVDGRTASEILKKAGFPYEESTLRKFRCIGGGPVFLKHGNRVCYRPSALAAWLESRTQELANTSKCTMPRDRAA